MTKIWQNCTSPFHEIYQSKIYFYHTCIYISDFYLFDLCKLLLVQHIQINVHLVKWYVGLLKVRVWFMEGKKQHETSERCYCKEGSRTTPIQINFHVFWSEVHAENSNQEMRSKGHHRRASGHTRERTTRTCDVQVGVGQRLAGVNAMLGMSMSECCVIVLIIFANQHDTWHKQIGRHSM